MSERYVDLGHGRRCTLGAYVKGWKMAKASEPDTQVSVVPGHFGGGTVKEVLRELDRGMHNRINRHLPHYGRGRKWSSDWYWQTWRMAREVNTPRLVVSWLPPEFKERLGHRLDNDRY